MTRSRTPNTPIPHLQLVFEAPYGARPLATVHPHGPLSSFRAVVRIPPTASPGHARIFASAQDHQIRLVVTR